MHVGSHHDVPVILLDTGQLPEHAGLDEFNQSICCKFLHLLLHLFVTALACAFGPAAYLSFVLLTICCQ